MMFCPKCGKEVADGTAFCPNCGEKLNGAPDPAKKDEFFEDVRPAQNTPPPSTKPVQPAKPAQPQQTATKEGSNTLAIVGFILSFFFATAGLICSIIGLHQCKQYKDNNGKGLAIAGIIISSIEIFISLIIGFVYGAVLIEYITEIINSSVY